MDLEKSICINDFIQNGFNIFTSRILVATYSDLFIPKNINEQIIVKKFTNKDWDSCINIHYDDCWEYGDSGEQIKFLKQKLKLLGVLCH